MTAKTAFKIFSFQTTYNIHRLNFYWCGVDSKIGRVNFKIKKEIREGWKEVIFPAVQSLTLEYPQKLFRLLPILEGVVKFPQMCRYVY